MCELLGLSSADEVSFRFSLEAFALHGGRTHANKDGWGLSLRSGRETFLVKEAVPASNSPWVRLVEREDTRTTLAIAHVRRASKGSLSLENTHPFKREMGGSVHVFAHNGDVSPLCEAVPLDAAHFQPIGETDSEHAFCLLLESLSKQAAASGAAPDLDAKMETVVDFAKMLRGYGTANFLYSDNEFLFVHAHKRRYDDGGLVSEPRWPGLQMRTVGAGSDLSSAGVFVEPGGDEVVLIASVPLHDDESWEPIPEATVLALRDGAVVARSDGGTGR